MKPGSNRIFVWALIAASLLALTAFPAHGLAQSKTTVQVTPQSLRLQIDETAKIDLLIDQVSGLYGAELHLKFDPEAIEIVDAQPDQDGIQIEAGAMPIPDLVVLNAVDNQKGTIDYAVTQLPPNQPGTGSGVIASLTVRAKKATSTEIQIEQLLLANTDGKGIEATSVHGHIKIVNTLSWIPFVVGGALLLGLGASLGLFAIKRK